MKLKKINEDNISIKERGQKKNFRKPQNKLQCCARQYRRGSGERVND